jgi:hypothetical protein
MLSAKNGTRSRGGLNTRWATLEDSIVVVGYVGPVRAFDATMLGDSVYAAIRSYDLCLAGPVPTDEGLGPSGLRFLARPWVFGTPWMREAIERSRIETTQKGWRLSGQVACGDGTHPFSLELGSRMEPRSLSIRSLSQDRSYVTVRYGPLRRYSGGKLPRWVEWTHGDAMIRIDIDEYATTKSRTLRHPPPADEDWTVLALDEPRGRDLIRSLLGDGEAEVGP